MITPELVKQNMDTTIQKRAVYEILKSPPSQDNPRGRAVANVLILLIFLNVIAAVLETDAGIYQQYGQMLDTFAFFSVVVFVVATQRANSKIRVDANPCSCLFLHELLQLLMSQRRQGFRE